ncbi:MAG: PKD domain-containing protein [Desulfobulbaceae bacterium]|nr:PKD domain-containing protein [Desulfobulbaceae bacterium]
MMYRYFLFLFLLCLLPIDSHALPQDYTVQVNFSFDAPSITEKQILAYRLYKNAELACENGPVAPQVLDCSITTEPGTYDFTLTALYSDGSQSPHSAPFPFTFANPAPELQAVITASTIMGDAPLSVTFDGSGSSGEFASYAWNFGDGNEATGATTTHSFTTPGTYTTTLTVNDTTGLSHQTSLVITATEPPPPPPEPPTAVISSSNAVGEAPYNVSIDGSGSYTQQPPITSYHWDFGDGATASGATVSHTYQQAGSYTARLQVTDSAGLTADASTPVVITAPPPENQEPIASFNAFLESELPPYTVSFDTSASNDPDGWLETFSWDFGDGSTTTGPHPQHTFPGAADYTVTLVITDNQGATATTSQAISIPEENEINLPLEIGELQLDHNWARVTFSQPFIDPIVIAGPPTYEDAAPVTVRIRNITPNGFDIRLQEWDYLDGNHAPETLSYIALEKGTYTLPDGSKLEAGTFTGGTRNTSVTLQQPFDQIPVILSQIITENERDTVTGRIRNVTQQSFQYKLQEQEKTKNRHVDEAVAYLAWEPGQGELNGLLYEIATTPEGVTSNWATIAYQIPAQEPPSFFADLQTTNAEDTVSLRIQNATTANIQTKMQEEQSKDDETDHPTEQVGYILIGSNIF